MRKFVFRLQTVLDRTLQQEDIQLQELSNVQREQAENKRAQTRVEDERQRAMATIAEIERTAFDVLRVQGYYLHLDALAGKMKELQAEAEEIARRLLECQQALMVTMRKRQTLEKLRERQLAEYRKTVDKQENETLSEAGLRRRERELADERIRWDEMRARGEGIGDEWC